MNSTIAARLAAVLGLATATTLVVLPVAGAAAPAENPAARNAVIELTVDTTPRVPDDFGAVMGYRPVVIGGQLANPDGACSSPVTLPAEFEPSCKAHDLGYDLLRYADRSGEPLGGWARRALDDMLARHLRDACAERIEPWRAGCRSMAEIAAVAVRTNSWRQDDGAPVREPSGPYLGGSVLAAGLSIGAVRRWSR